MPLDPSAPRRPQTLANGHAKRKTGTTRQRTGCLTCRQRRKRCDELYPVCGHCLRLNLVCARKAPENIVAKIARGASTEMNLPGQPWTPTMLRTPDPIDVCGYAESSHGIDQRFLLRYYTNVLSKLLTTNHENNSFLSVFPRMAIESPTLRAAIVAWSSAHLSRYDKRHESTAIELQSLAMSSLASILGTPLTANLDTTLAAVLVLCCTDVDQGDTGRWYTHMEGARDIIASARLVETDGKILSGPDCYMTTSDGAWLVRNFAYHDILASVTLGQPPLLKDAYWIGEEDQVIDANLGVATQIFALISRVSCLMQAEHWVEELSEFDLVRQAIALESELLAWTPPVDSHELLVELAECFRCSALIHLYRQCKKRFPGSLESFERKIQTQVGATIKHMERIPTGSLPSCGVLFPLFMAGGEATKESDMQAIQTRLELQQQHRAFGNIQCAREILQELWQERIAAMKVDGPPVDWLDILNRKEWKLLLT